MVSRLDTSYSRAYRIVSRKYPPFDGAGTYRYGSRWISPGRWVVHAAETYALAVLENLVHWQANALPTTLVTVRVDISDRIKQEKIDHSHLPTSALNDYTEYRALGNDWYDRGETAVLWVPSVVSPVEYNLLFNQEHIDFSLITVQDPLPARIDPRLWGTGENILE